ncbi:MAG: response regulator [Thermoleophilia bacterium]|nr:response regulator [Thermoleophilia bacterium]
MAEGGPRVLVVDDERAIRRLLRTSLAAFGCTVFEAADGHGALHQVTAHRPDVVILDLGLPDMDGVQVLTQIRSWSSIPVIVLSVRDEEPTKVAALDAGADDYLSKPFGVDELMARIRVVLRRSVSSATEPVFQNGGITVDLGRRFVAVDGREVALTPTEYDLLLVFVRHAGKVLTHRQLLTQVWGVAYQTETQLLRVNISNLRRKLEPNPARPVYLITEPGVGYRLRLV